MQGAQLKKMGIVKPWAPPRSYGLVIRLDDDRPAAIRCTAASTASTTASSPPSNATATLFCSPRGRDALLRLPARRHRGGAARHERHRSSNCARRPRITPACRRSRTSISTLRRGEIHAHRRRERRRQIDADQGDGRRRRRRPRARCWSTAADVAPKTPVEALRLGIAMVFQETSLVPTMTVAQNLFLGQEQFFNRLRGIYIAAQQFLQSLQFRRRPDGDRRQPARRRQEADGRDRARRAAQAPRSSSSTSRPPSLTPEEKKYFFDLVARPEGARRLGHLHLACARGGAAARRPHHGAARRQACRDRRRRAISTARASSRRWSGATCRNTLYGQRKTQRAAARRARAVACRICAWRRW